VLGEHPVAAGYRRVLPFALAEHEKKEAYPEAVAQAHADFAELQDADALPAPAASASNGRTTRSPRRQSDHDQSRRHFLYRNYSSRRNRRYPRRRQIKHTIPERKDQRANRQRRGGAGGRPTGFDKTICKRRNEVERTINARKGFRAVATRFDKRAYIFHGTVTVAAIRLWVRS
jgi:transposase